MNEFNYHATTNLIPDKPLEILENIPLAQFTTLKIGGPARFFVKASTEKQVIEACKFAEEKQLELFVLGGGSNILVADKGFDGLVVQIALQGVVSEPPAASGRNASVNERVVLSGRNASVNERVPSADQRNTLHDCRVSAQAGEDWDEFVEYCVDSRLAGVECLSGIPGFIGGTPIQNVGAYGQEVSETIVGVRCFDRPRREIVELTNADCGFAYRTSIFNTSERDRFIVLSVTYALQKDGPPKIAYKDLKEVLGDRKATLRETRDTVLRIRAAKSMVIDKNDPNSRSAGSFFKNPVVPNEVLADISRKMQVDNVPHFRMNKGSVKILAAWLIEQSGFQKGFKLGNAGISANHSLAIVNRGGASADEILSLKNLIQRQVAAKFGIELRPEPVFVGFD